MKLPGTPETFSLYGEPLHKSPIMLWLPSEKEAYKAKLKELHDNYLRSKQEYLGDPEDPEKLLWYGRRTGILGNFMEAAGLYSIGVKKWPEDPRFYRFRGHRFIILRRIDLAIDDFNRAADLIKDRPDQMELYASGGRSENKMGVSSFNWNVYYHQGFTYFVAGKHREAVQAYRLCMKTSDNFESIVATSHWQYMVLLRLGRHDEAEKLLEPIEQGTELIEVGDYYQTLLMYKGSMAPEELLELARSEGPIRFMTRAQAIGNLHLSKGETGKAVEIFKEIMSAGSWTGGVYLMAEAELKRLGVVP